MESLNRKLNNLEEAQNVSKNLEVEPVQENQNEPEVTIELERSDT